jgi:DNA-binding Lrp family transcriptional regulator
MLMLSKNGALDAVDIKILQILQKDARSSNARLAELIGLSQSACCQRVRRLEKQHYITGYSTSVAVNKLCENALTLFTLVKLTSDQIHVVKDFETFVRSNASILECHAILGEHDYLLRFLVPNFDHYGSILKTKMERDLKVRAYTTLVAHRGFSKAVDLASLLVSKSVAK